MYEQIHASKVDDVWHVVAPWIAQAIGDSDTWSDLEAIKDNAKRGFSHIWIGRKPNQEVDVVFVSETWFLDGRRAFVIRWLTGKDMNEWIEDLEYIENWASSNGYQSVHIWGRPGWQRVCKPLGYKHEFTVMSKPLMRGLQ